MERLAILLTGGGSGGSATPVPAVGSYLRALRSDVDLLLVGTREGPEQALAAAAGIPFVAVRSGKLRRYWSWQNLTDPFRVVAGGVESLPVVRGFRPAAAFGAGGFASVPPLLSAAMLGVPVHIHQQDVLPGLANRLLAPFARSISVALRGSERYFPSGRTTVVGNPVRSAILNGCATRAHVRFALEPNLPVVLATGGGTGALGLNRLVVEAAPRLSKHCQIVHLTGRGRAVPLAQPLDRYQQVEFVTDEMADLLAAASLVITRAGMGTLSELGALGKPAIVIPMPRSHQLANAEALAQSGAAVVCDQEALDAAQLAATVRGLLENAARCEELAQAIRQVIRPDAAMLIARIVLGLTERC
jgi:UDP-N-acetylglucosamine--N-acetylmuramyl-(pentapeptide) pyrophosphoryl-undecaprenol N-acetylglucosamine transferase